MKIRSFFPIAFITFLFVFISSLSVLAEGNVNQIKTKLVNKGYRSTDIAIIESLSSKYGISIDGITTVMRTPNRDWSGYTKKITKFLVAKKLIKKSYPNESTLISSISDIYALPVSLISKAKNNDLTNEQIIKLISLSELLGGTFERAMADLDAVKEPSSKKKQLVADLLNRFDTVFPTKSDDTDVVQ